MVNPTPRYFQKEALIIPDEVELALQLLEDDLRNHRLKHIVKKVNVVRRYQKPKYLTDLPGIEIEKIGFVGEISPEVINEDDDIGYTWHSDLAFNLIMTREGKIYYPPADPGKAPLEANRYEGGDKILNVLEWIVHSILSENRKYQSDTVATFQWDNRQLMDYIPIHPYEGVRDTWEVTLVYRFKFEVVMRSGS